MLDTPQVRRRLANLPELIGVCAALGAGTFETLAPEEQSLLADAPKKADQGTLDFFKSQILEGKDPLGEEYCRLVSPQDRRPLGQTFTPEVVIESMVAWAEDHGRPERIIDPGSGSGRYLLAAVRKFPTAKALGADIDAVSTLMLRANLAVLGLADRVEVHLGDYRSLHVPVIDGTTLYIGNPPYVRHHQIDPAWKRWLLDTARRRGLKASGLAGLHIHFFLATAEHGRPGDYGAFITSSEWLDVNYGSLARQLLLDGLGGESLHVVDPESSIFSDATTTGTISCFEIGTPHESVRVRRVNDVNELGRLNEGRPIARQRLAEANRWSVLTRTTPTMPRDYIELGELCRVHRGQVTGANRFWIADASVELPESVLFSTVTKAKDLFSAGARLAPTQELRRVIDLPVDLDVFDAAERKLVERFLRKAKNLKVDQGYVASNRKAWWSVGLRDAAPVLASYMARRPPAFVRNDAKARHINIAHGLYPRDPMDPLVLDRLASHLRVAVTLSQGRTYAGGLTKFEPKEMERLPVPSLEVLREGTFL